METPPVPWTRTVSPDLSFPSSTKARQAVKPAHGRVAASFKFKFLGIRVIALAGMAILSAA